MRSSRLLCAHRHPRGVPRTTETDQGDIRHWLPVYHALVATATVAKAAAFGICRLADGFNAGRKSQIHIRSNCFTVLAGKRVPGRRKWRAFPLPGEGDKPGMPASLLLTQKAPLELETELVSIPALTAPQVACNFAIRLALSPRRNCSDQPPPK
jgi:hypothetical protein